MAETLREDCKWIWADVMYDLIEQGGLEENSVYIDPLSINGSFCAGLFKDKIRFFVTWTPHFLLVSVTEDTPELIDAFTDILPVLKQRGFWVQS